MDACCLFFQHVSAVILIVGCAGAWTMHMPLVGWGSSWLPVGCPLVQVAGCTREMRTVIISAVSWNFVGDGLLMLRNVGTATCIFSGPSAVAVVHSLWNPYMAVVAPSSLPVQLMGGSDALEYAEIEAPMVYLTLSSHAPQQWLLALWWPQTSS